MITWFQTKSRPHKMVLVLFVFLELYLAGALEFIASSCKGITPFSRFPQNVKNSMVDKYNKDTDN